MADFVYTHATQQIATAQWDLSSGTPDVRFALVMTNTTLDTEPDVANMTAASTVDEFDGSNYSANGIAATNEAVSEDATNNRAEFTADNITFSAISAGTRLIQAVVAYAFDTAFITSSIPIAWIETGFNPTTGIAANGGDVAITWNAQGIIQLTSPNAP